MKNPGSRQSGHVETLIMLAIVMIIFSFIMAGCVEWARRRAVARDHQEVIRVLKTTIPDYESVEKIEQDKERKPGIYRAYFVLTHDKPRQDPHMAVVVVVKGVAGIESVDHVLFKPK